MKITPEENLRFSARCEAKGTLAGGEREEGCRQDSRREARKSRCAGISGFAVGRTALEALGNQEADEIDHAVGIGPLVVIPAQDLDAVAYDLGQRRVEDGTALVALEVGADEQVFVVAEDALEGAFRSLFEGGVQSFGSDGLLGDEGQIDDGDVGCGDADGKAVQLARTLGMTSLRALAAPVEVGIIDKAAARARRRSLCGVSRMT